MKRRTVLVVDDQPAVRRLLTHLFEMAGYEVLEAADGDEALEAIQAERPDACILDVMMPRVDGWEVLARVRADPDHADLPVILLTAKGEPSARLKGWELGCDAFIPKPFDPSECLSEVPSVLARSPAERVALRERQRAVAAARTHTVGRTGGRRSSR